MKYVYFDCSSGVSGDMLLGALLDLGVSSTEFRKKMAELELPVKITARETKRASLRGLKADVRVQRKKHITRKWSDVRALLKMSSFPSRVKDQAMDIFKRLFEAEARVHGQTFSKAHLHEAGADDAIIDIVGSCWLAHKLNISEFYASPLNLGGGWVKASHGTLPVPPPAVGELLKNIPVYSAHIKKELVTPTGAAILSSLVREFLPFPELCYDRIGYGAGTENFPGFPNILRAFYGETRQFKGDKKVFVIETNIDDDNPQILGHFLEIAIKMGALDVYFTPIFMKKNRPATKLTLLAELAKIDALIRAIFQETSSIGVRYFPVHRRVLERKIHQVSVLGEEIPIKAAYLDGQEVNIRPEFQVCQKVARKNNRTVKEIISLVMKEWERTKE
jgi:uncharacterized protein (TIGR00299 family) protein